VLSFDQFGLGLSERVTFIVGPNGAGKSNLARLLTICQRALDSGDGVTGDADRLLASFLAARHVGSQSPGVEARVALRMTDVAERELVTEFVRAMVTGALTSRGLVHDMAALDTWAETEITETKLLPLMEGQIVASHPGTPDGRWQCVYEFTAPAHDQSERRYQWIMLGQQSGTILDADSPVTTQGSDILTRITGSSSPPSSSEIPIPHGFQLLDLLPMPDLATMSCTFELFDRLSASQRRFAEMASLPLIAPRGRRMVSLATVVRVILRRALVQTTDMRLLPSGGTSWSSLELTLVAGAEARLPELLLQLKNGGPVERGRYQRIRELFAEFTQGRGCEVRLMQVQQPSQDGQSSTPAQAPAVWVTVDASSGSIHPDPEVPIEFAGVGAWEALVLASVLGEPSASVVVLDEPAVALHASLQRQVGAHLIGAPAQFLVITHSPELLPLADAADVRLVRLDRDNQRATTAWAVEEACRAKVTRKLVAKGNDRLPFAWRAILCEGQDDVEAIVTFSDRMCIDLRRRNIAVVDCGSRENLPDYIWFCAQLGLKYLAVMDGDSTTPNTGANSQAVREAVNLRHGGELVEFPVSLERTFGVNKPRRGPSLVPDAIRALPFDGDMPDPVRVPAEVVRLAEAIRRLTR
jgi:predicted ATPase